MDQNKLNEIYKELVEQKRKVDELEIAEIQKAIIKARYNVIIADLNQLMTLCNFIKK